MSKAKLRVLLVGAGVMGSFHARVISQSNKTVLAAVVDSREDVGRATAHKFGATWLPELPLEMSSFDAVVVATPTESHFELASTILNSRLPLLLEKPLTKTLTQTQELLALSAKYETPLVCGLLERFNPAVLTAMTISKNPLHISSTRHSPYAPRIPTGVAWDLLIHDVDLMTRLKPSVPPRSITGGVAVLNSKSLPGEEDVAECTVSFADGALGHASASRIGHRKVRSLQITESDSVIDVDLLRKDVTVYRNVSDQMIEDNNRGYRQQTIIEIPEVVTSQEPLAAQLDHFVAIINGTRDQEVERRSLLLSHQLVDSLLTRQPFRIG